MDELIIRIIRDAISVAPNLIMQSIKECVWIRDVNKPEHESRWCIIEASNYLLTIKNGRLNCVINLADPDSLTKLNESIINSLSTTRLYSGSYESDIL